MSPSKHYSSDNYSRESNYESNKYKSDSQWDQRNSYQEVHFIIRKYLSYVHTHTPIIYYI